MFTSHKSFMSFEKRFDINIGWSNKTINLEHQRSDDAPSRKNYWSV